MIVFRKFVYLHMPKTGGTWLSDALCQGHGARQIGPSHTPAAKLPKKFNDFHLFGTVRDPLSWYVSWYNHCVRHESLWDQLRNYCGGAPEFNTVVQNLLRRRNPPQHYSVILRTPDARWARNAWLEGSTGLYSFLFEHVYGDRVQTLLRQENLVQDVSELLNLDIDLERFPPNNTATQMTPSDKKVTTDVYSDETRETVLEFDGELARALGY